MDKVKTLSDKRGKIFVPIDDEYGYEVDEHVLRMYASDDNRVVGLGNGSPGSHNEFIKCLVKDYIRLYREDEERG